MVGIGPFEIIIILAIFALMAAVALAIVMGVAFASRKRQPGNEPEVVEKLRAENQKLREELAAARQKP